MKYEIKTLLASKSVWSKDDFVFFWSHTQKGAVITKACLSQWHPCSFVVDGQIYNCAEQYMMAEKARIFGDEEVLKQILLENNQMTIKQFGRMVKNYDDKVWAAKRFDVVISGNVAKFAQNSELRSFLLSTENKVLVEASPKDRIWGIGLDEFNPDACNPSAWDGGNLLGFALMEVRDIIRQNGNEK